MKRITKSGKKKFLLGLALSLVLAMAVGSFAMGETPANSTTAGPFIVNGGTQGQEFDYQNSILTVHSGDLTVSTSQKTTERIVVDGAANITLNGVNITATEGAALTIEDNATFDVKILLADGTTNILKGEAGEADTSGKPGYPGIQKNGTDVSAGMLTIDVPTGAEGTGKLEATGGDGAAGIGSGHDESGSCNIAINGGIVTATGGVCAAGIGGGATGSGSAIEINGGVVTAIGTSVNGAAGIDGGGAGIGGGVAGNGDHITISGGKVTAVGGDGAAGIGGGTMGNGIYITISGGVVTAIGGVEEFSDYLLIGAGIGGGGSGDGLFNTLNGSDAVVYAASGDGRVDALQGFDSASYGSLTQGMAFTGVVTDYTTNPITVSWSEGKLYGDVTIASDVEVSADLTVAAGETLTIEDGVTMNISSEATFQNEGNLIIDGTIKNDGIMNFADVASVVCKGNGKIETLLKYDPQGGIFNDLSDVYQLYKDSTDTVKTYQGLPQQKTNDTFNGWNRKADGTGEYLKDMTVDLNLHTAYADMDYTVVFNSQGGSDVDSVSPIKYNSKVAEPTDPTKEGYTFDAWYKDEGCTTLWDFDKDTVKGDMTLYAGWTAEPEPEPTPTPEPTPDPSVNPDGSDGSGSGASSKTSDPFMGGAALALLGVATTGAILTRKFR